MILMGISRFVKHYPFRYAKMITASYEISSYLNRNTTRLLNVGVQTNHPKGWLNIDTYPTFGVVYLDATKMSKLPTASFDAVLCEHMIEHVPKTVGEVICQESRRILKPNGVARFVTPDAERLCRMILAPGQDEERYLELFREYRKDPSLTRVDTLNAAFHDYGHQHLYTKEEFEAMLRKVGFSTIISTSASGQECELFRGAQGHGPLVGEEFNDLESFALEASA
jgi:predicted SAM-dependent methyltransferase